MYAYGILLDENSLLYLNFVKGEPAKNDFQMSSSGDRMYFYFHQLTKELTKNGFKEIKVYKVEYKKLETKKTFTPY